MGFLLDLQNRILVEGRPSDKILREVDEEFDQILGMGDVQLNDPRGFLLKLD